MSSPSQPSYRPAEGEPVVLVEHHGGIPAGTLGHASGDLLTGVTFPGYGDGPVSVPLASLAPKAGFQPTFEPDDLLTEGQAQDLKDDLAAAYMTSRGHTLGPGELAWLWQRFGAQIQDA